MANRPIRFLPLILIGLAAFLAVPTPFFCADAPAHPARPGETEAGDEVAEEKGPGPAEVKFWSAIRLLASSRPGDVEHGRSDLQAAADMEFSHAQLELGRYLLSGAYGFKKNERKGANLFILAAERGNAYAQAAAGQCFYAGVGVRKNEERAVRWLEAAIDAGADYSRPEPPADLKGQPSQSTVAGAVFVDHTVTARANAQFLLARIEHGRKNAARAHELYVAAATAGVDGRDGHVDAARQAALNFAFGQGTDRDPAKAREMLDHSRTLAKRQGAAWIQSWVESKQLDEFATADVEEDVSTAGDALFARIQYDIARTFSDRKSKDYDPREAATWYEVAAESGQVWPMMHLAFLLGGNELGSPDPVAAFQWWLKAGAEPAKHQLAAGNLAICYQNGIGVEKDPAKAAEIFERYKHSNILCHLGSIGAAPATVQTYEQGIKLLEAAAKKGDSHAQYLMGMRYREGWDVAIDQAKAESWFKKAAKARHPAAIRELGELAELIPWGMREPPPKALKLAMEHYRQACDLGDAVAAANLAHMHQHGRGTPVDLETAGRYYRRALDLDPKYAIARNNLAIIQRDRLAAALSGGGGGDVDSLRASMLANLEEAAGLGLHLASLNLGHLYSKGELVPQDYEKAYQHFDQAAAEGVADAHYQLGLMHENGLGVPVTLTEAAYHYRLAALDGHRAALDQLINSYVSGRGVDVDWDMATFWLLKSVQQGNIAPLVTLADIQLRRGDPKMAFRMFKSLAEVPDTLISGFACERLSLCYEFGSGVKANPALAKKHFDRAIEKENGDALTRLAQDHFANNRLAEGVAVMTRASRTSANACYFLGQMYFFGTHVESDRARAVELMRNASRWNHPKAMYFLAAAAYNRVPTAPGLDEAIRFAESAEKLGLPEATSLREKLEKRRDQTQEEAEQVARARSG